VSNACRSRWPMVELRRLDPKGRSSIICGHNGCESACRDKSIGLVDCLLRVEAASQPLERWKGGTAGPARSSGNKAHALIEPERLNVDAGARRMTATEIRIGSSIVRAIRE
jgi:hypothetical protein